MGFGKSMVWGEPPNHVHDSYFCSIDVKRVNKKKRKSLNYQSFPSVIQPIAHSDDIPLSEFKLPDLSIDEHSEEEPYDHKELTDDDKIDDEDFAYPSMLFNQKNLSDLIRDLSLSKEFFTTIETFYNIVLKSLSADYEIKSLCCFLVINLTLFSVKIFLVYL